MNAASPAGEIDRRFSDEGATATPWAEARAVLEAAKAYWLSTVRVDGRPHVTTIAALWLDGALYFTTGKGEQKAHNLRQNVHCVVTAGCSDFEGLDVVVEGDAVRVTDQGRLQRLADAYISKYDDLFVFEVDGDVLQVAGSDDPGFAFEVRPVRAFGFGKGDPFSQTRWRFEPT